MRRLAEVSLGEVDRGLIETVRAMGVGCWAIRRELLVPEALQGIVVGFTGMLATFAGASVIARAIEAGGLGELAIRYGCQRFETALMGCCCGSVNRAAFAASSVSAADQ